MMELKHHLSESLKLLRKERDATLDEFSADIGISRSNLQEIEQGRANATLDTVDIIAQNLGVSALELLSAKPDTPRQIRSLISTVELFALLPAEKQTLAVYHFTALIELLGGG